MPSVLFAVVLLFALAGATNPTCDLFAIRNRGETLFFIDSSAGVLGIPNDLDAGSVLTKQIILGDYLMNVFPSSSGMTLGLRKRRMDAASGRYLVPRAVLEFALDGTHVIYNDELRDVSDFTLYELRDFLRMARPDDLTIEGTDDPFNLQVMFDPSGNYCKPGDGVLDCVSSMVDIFEEVTIGTSTEVNMLLAEMLMFPQAGEDGYTGMIQNVFATEDVQILNGQRIVTIANENGVSPGQPRFRLMDSEVDDVFVLEAVALDQWIVTPGVYIAIYGWRGGQVMDFSMDETSGMLTGGHIIVGPHPVTNPNDMVEWSVVNGWAGLVGQVPGPALRLGSDRNTRLYVSNQLGTADSFTPSWLGLDVPHDQSTITVDPTATVVFEFRARGTTSIYNVYEQSFGTQDAGLAGPIIVDGGAQTTLTADREYVVFMNTWNTGAATVGGNSFPGTSGRLSGWFRDVHAITVSAPAGDDSGDTIVTIDDSPRPGYTSSDTDSLHPTIKDDCPAYGGPLVGRLGTGCVINGVHVNKGHQITSTTWSPGTMVEISGHTDDTSYPFGSINGPQRVIRESSTAFRIKKIGTNGTSGGTGGFVAIWRLHKANVNDETVQNNGASGAYYRFNYGENVNLRFFNLASDTTMHLHGHTGAIWAQDGFQLDFPQPSSYITVTEGSTADVMVPANNPNRYGAWWLASTYPGSLTNAVSAWPTSPLTPGGMAAFIDYTEGSMGWWALDADGKAAPFLQLPPTITLARDNLVLERDHLLWAVDTDPNFKTEYVWVSASTSWNWVFLDGTAGPAIGNVSNHLWTQVDGPADVMIWTPDQDTTRLTGFTVDGTYHISYTAWGSPFADGTVNVSSTATVTITVSDTPFPLDPVVEIIADPTFVRLAAMDTLSDAGTGRSFPRGHATFKLREADVGGVNTIAVSNGKFLAGVFPVALPSTFYRWYTAGEDKMQPDVWLNIPNDFSVPGDQFSWAITRAVFDSRVSTHGFVFASDLGLGVPEGWAPPAVSRAVFPLWQGASVAGADFNSPHDVYFLILEASDVEFCELYGCAYTPSLASIPPSATNDVSLYKINGQLSTRNEFLRDRTNTGTFAQDRATEFVFTVDPGNVPATRPEDDTGYTPVKSFRFVGKSGVSRVVFANMPFVYWGLRQVQRGTYATAAELMHERKMLLVDSVFDTNGDGIINNGEACNPFVRAYPPNPDLDLWNLDLNWRDGNPPANDLSGFWAPRDGNNHTATSTHVPSGGPPGCDSIDDELTIPKMRRWGGQLLDVPNFRKMYVTIKLHMTQSGLPSMGNYYYYTSTDTSDYSTSQFEGSIWAPKLQELGRYGNGNPYVATYKEMGNGKTTFYPDSTVSVIPDSNAYTPYWHTTTLYWNCGTYWFGTDVWEGDFEPVVWQHVINGDQSWLAPNNRVLLSQAQANYLYTEFNFDDEYPLSANLKSTSCWAFIREKTGRDSGMLYALEEGPLIASNDLWESEMPATYAVTAATSNFNIANRHVTLTFNQNGPYDAFLWVPDLDTVPAYSSLTTTDVDGGAVWPMTGTWGLVTLGLAPSAGALNALSVGGFPLNVVAWQPIVDDANPDENKWDYANLVSLVPNPTNPWVIPSALLAAGATAPFITVDSSSPFGYKRTVGAKPILFAVIGCSNFELASLVGAAYRPALQFIPDGAATWGHYWEEPPRDSDGFINPQDVEVALRSFIFYEPAPSVATPDPLVAALYTPYKRFHYSGQTVTCNMPFYQWGFNADQQMVLDNSTAPLDRADFGQVLGAVTDRRDGASLNLLEFTVKIHRAVRFDDAIYPYFAVFDASSSATAKLYGVPQSARLIQAGLANLQNSVVFLHMFLNGVPCDGCSPYNFQEPIADANTISTSLHQLDTLLWDCDLTFPATSAGFTDNLGQSCAFVAQDAVDKGTIQSTVVYNPDVESLIDDRRAYQFASTRIYANTPWVAQLNLSPAPLPPTQDPWTLKKLAGTTYIITATESARFWSVTTLATKDFVAPGVHSPQSYQTLMPTNPPQITLGSQPAAILLVKPGDRVLFFIASDNLVTPNGVVFGRQRLVNARAALDDLNAFFETNPLSVTLNYATDPKFVPPFSSAPYGYTHSSLGPLTIFDGYVLENVDGEHIYFTSYTYGPQFMNGVLVVTHDDTGYVPDFVVPPTITPTGCPKGVVASKKRMASC